MYGAVTLYGRTFQNDPFVYFRITRSHNPNWQANWFRLLRFRSPLLTESLRVLFLRLIRCFSSPGSPPPAYLIQPGMMPYDRHRISPFGHPRIDTFVQLPVAFRRLHALLRLLVPRHPSYTLCSLQNGKLFHGLAVLL